MDFRQIIKEVGRGKNHARDLDFDTARALYTHMLNGEVADLEMGGILIALRIKGEGGDAGLLRGDAGPDHAPDAAGGEADAHRHSHL